MTAGTWQAFVAAQHSNNLGELAARWATLTGPEKLKEAPARDGKRQPDEAIHKLQVEHCIPAKELCSGDQHYPLTEKQADIAQSDVKTTFKRWREAYQGNVTGDEEEPCLSPTMQICFDNYRSRCARCLTPAQKKTLREMQRTSQGLLMFNRSSRDRKPWELILTPPTLFELAGSMDTRVILSLDFIQQPWRGCFLRCTSNEKPLRVGAEVRVGLNLDAVIESKSFADDINSIGQPMRTYRVSYRPRQDMSSFGNLVVDGITDVTDAVKAAGMAGLEEHAEACCDSVAAVGAVLSKMTASQPPSASTPPATHRTKQRPARPDG